MNIHYLFDKSTCMYVLFSLVRVHVCIYSCFCNSNRLGYVRKLPVT